MKHIALSLLGLALLPYAVQADQAPNPVCVNALEQLATLRTAAPVYGLAGTQERNYIADADRPAEAAHLKTIVDTSCSPEPKTRQREDAEAQHLHHLRSPGCIEDRERLSTMEKKSSRTPQDDLLRTRERVHSQCPAVDLSNVWLIQWMPPPGG